MAVLHKRFHGHRVVDDATPLDDFLRDGWTVVVAPASASNDVDLSPSTSWKTVTVVPEEAADAAVPHSDGA